MLSKKIVSGLVGIAFIAVGTVDMGWAKQGKGNGPADPTKVRAKLRPDPEGIVNQVSEAEGHAMRFTLKHRGKNRDRFEARVEVPVDMSTVTPDDFMDNQLTLILNRAGNDYATCTMDFEEIDALSEVAEWKLSIRQRGTEGTLQNRAGACEDLDGVNILPAAEAEDTATAIGDVAGGHVELSGAFK